MSKLNGLHPCCGPIYLKEDEYFTWINVDIQSCFRTDICCDVLELEKHIKSESVDFIWCCHGLEHLDYPKQAIDFLKVCFTLLKKDGIMRVAVPDLELVAGYYLKRDVMLRKMYGDGTFYYLFDNYGERFNYFLKEWSHKITYDCQMLCDIFQYAGFKIYGKKGFNDSIINVWHNDRLELESIFFEAGK